MADYTMVLRADDAKRSAGHKIAGAVAFLAAGHLASDAPSGADVFIENDIPAGSYTFALSKDDSTGHVTVTLTTGTVP